METLTVGLDAAKHPVLRPREPSPILRVMSTPIYNAVARAFQWDPLVDGSDAGPKNRLARKKGYRPKKSR